MAKVAFSKYLPPDWRHWLNEHPLPAFPASWGLREVAEESHRRFKSNRTPQRTIRADVLAWAVWRLGTDKGLTGDDWTGLTKLGIGDSYDWHPQGVAGVLDNAHAYGDSIAWRESREEKKGRDEQLLRLIVDLRSYLRSDPQVNISLMQVAGSIPALEPWAETKERLEGKRTRKLTRFMDNLPDGTTNGEALDARIQEWKRLTVPAPSLMHFLHTLMQQMEGTGKTFYPLPPLVKKRTQTLKKLEAQDQESFRKQFGLIANPPWERPDPKLTFNSGDWFGGYPKQKGALRRSVVAAFGNSLIRYNPRATVAGLVHGVTYAWFGSAPSVKEINATLAPLRKKAEQRFASQGMTPDKFRADVEAQINAEKANKDQPYVKPSRAFRSFLDVE